MFDLRNGSSGSELDEDDHSARDGLVSSKRSSKQDRRLGYVPPKPPRYSVEQDPRILCSFVRGVARYLEDLDITRVRAFDLISGYLRDKALHFYQDEVEYNEDNWTLTEFFEELFNFCFDPDFRILKRIEWMSLKQGNMSVVEYARELDRLAECFGGMAEEIHVIKLWAGLNGKLQGDLWRDGYRPEGTLRTLVMAAKDLEFAYRMHG